MPFGFHRVPPPASPAGDETHDYLAYATTAGAVLAGIYTIGAAYWLSLASKRRKRQHADAAAQDDFQSACEYAISVRSSLSMKQRLRLYSYYKQATCGDAPTEVPHWTSVVDHTKHSSWSRRRGMSPAEAQARYVLAVEELSASGWRGNVSGLDATNGSRPSLSRPLATAQPHAARSERELRERVAELEAQLAQWARHTMRGWLHRFSAQGASWLSSAASSKWEPRFFVLTGEQLVYYRGEADSTPRRTIALANCVVVNEGVKVSRRQQHSFHIFSLWIVGTLDSERGPGSGALIRLSCASDEEARRWHTALEAATGQPMQTLGLNRCIEPSPPEAPPASADAQAAPAGAESGSGGGRSEGDEATQGKGQSAQAAASPPASPRRRHHHPFDPNLFPASRPMHRAAKLSLLSGGAEPANMTGLVNLVMLAFVVTNARLLLENLLHHGLLLRLPIPITATETLVDVGRWSWHDLAEPSSRGVATLAVVTLPCLAAYAIERAAVRTTPLSRYSRRFVVPLHMANVAASLVMPCALVSYGANVGGKPGAVLLLIVSVTAFLKLVSWAHVHHDLREADRESASLADVSDLDAKLAKFSAAITDTEGDHVHYPNNVTMTNLAFFLVAPTLCYQTDFPRSPRIRKGYLLSLSIRLVVLCTIIPAIVQQYMLPLLRSSVDPMLTGDWPQIVERTLKLALPVTYVWLTGFYAFFHVWLNLLAEVLRFGDRTFYKAWWNATDFESYWRMWNMPVHCWIVRHVYFPIQRHLTRDKSMTGFLCFTLSAVLHEVVVAFPLRSFYMPLAFFGMMSQVPMLPISSWIKRKTTGTAFEQAGNFVFWITFCIIGQPACVLLYYVHAT